MSDLVPFGRTGLKVSRLCFGTGSHGFPGVQSAMTVEALSELLLVGWENGVRFWDTALRYETHPHLKAALAQVPRSSVLVASKMHATSLDQGRRDIQRTLLELGTDYVDVMLMHEVDSVHEMEERQGALEALEEARDAGWIRALGLSTHSIDLLERAAGDPRLDVLFTNLNHAGIHMDADIKHYVAALEIGHAAGQGIYVHKTLGEGAFGTQAASAIAHNLSRSCVDSVCVGMKNREELEIALQAERTYWQPARREPTAPVEI